MEYAELWVLRIKEKSDLIFIYSRDLGQRF